MKSKSLFSNDFDKNWAFHNPDGQHITPTVGVSNVGSNQKFLKGDLQTFLQEKLGRHILTVYSGVSKSILRLDLMIHFWIWFFLKLKSFHDLQKHNLLTIILIEEKDTEHMGTYIDSFVLSFS